MVLSSGYAMPRVGLGTAHLFEAQIAANLAAGARLQTSYVDLLLIHWPLKFRPGTVLARDGAVGDFSATWAAMEALAASGKARSLGVSNFDEAQLSRLLDDAKQIPPAVNQVEAHPKFPNQA